MMNLLKIDGSYTTSVSRGRCRKLFRNNLVLGPFDEAMGYVKQLIVVLSV